MYPRTVVISACVICIFSAPTNAQVRDLELMGNHDNPCRGIGDADIVFFAAHFRGQHDFETYAEAFEEVKELTNCDTSAISRRNQDNERFALNGRLAILGWYDAEHPATNYWFGVQVDSRTTSRFIDCRRNSRVSNGFYGSGFVPHGCRTDVAGGSIFCQFADDDRDGITWRFNYTPSPR